jgi:hypothetical protein
MKRILLWLVTAALLVSCVSAAYSETNYSVSYKISSAWIQLVQLKYEPYPVNPGEYFDLWVKVQDTSSSPVENATFELVPEYPFSLDSNEDAVRTYGQLTSEPAVLHYKVRVSKDAVEGTNEIKLRYKLGESDSWASSTFDIEVAEARTDFDVVVQEISGSDVSIAIANIGKNDADSVVVRIPEQEDFEAAGTSGQMVGNLAAGDYTLVGFEITGKNAGNLNVRVGNGADNGRTHVVNVTVEKNPAQKKTLELQIDYTDAIGERRSITKEVPFAMGNNLAANSTSSGFAGRFNSTSSIKSIYTTWWFWIIIIVVLYAAWTTYKKLKKYREQKEEKKRRKSV